MSKVKSGIGPLLSNAGEMIGLVPTCWSPVLVRLAPSGKYE